MSAMPQKDKSLSRRSFLSWLVKGSLAGSALLGLGALGRFISFQNEENPPSQYDLGPATNYPIASRIPALVAQAIVIHNEQGFSALSLVCPHLGCRVNGSRFQPDGSLRNGPASRPMAFLRVEVNADGHLILYTG
jgi:nitrite reductase/ring-hydroxylating ferredoxin subunit